MAAGVGCSKQNGRRSRLHENYYQSLPPRVAKRKDRHVAKSSHGKYESVKELVAHQIAVEAKPRTSRSGRRIAA